MLAGSGRNSNTRPPYDDRALTFTDVKQQKLRIRKIRGRRKTRRTKCKRKERHYVKRQEADEHREKRIPAHDRYHVGLDACHLAVPMGSLKRYCRRG
jgi:hypothetical protein